MILPNHRLKSHEGETLVIGTRVNIKFNIDIARIFNMFIEDLEKNEVEWIGEADIRKADNPSSM